MSSRASFRTFAVLVGLAIALGVTAAQARAVPDYPNCTGKLQFKPKSITVTCADGGIVVRRISWSSWGESRARGSSSRASVNDCEPSCAQGKFHRYSVKLLLRRVRNCPSGRGRIFTRLVMTYVGSKPEGPRTLTQPLRCPSA